MTASAADDPKRTHVPLIAQIEEAKRELRLRYGVYAKRVRTGQMTQEAADAGIAAMRAIRDTLMFLAANEAEFRAVYRAKREREIENEELAEIERHPAVKAVCAAFPGAEVHHPGRSPSSGTGGAG